MKKIVILAAAILGTAALLSGCAGKKEAPAAAETTKAESSSAETTKAQKLRLQLLKKIRLLWDLIRTFLPWDLWEIMESIQDLT